MATYLIDYENVKSEGIKGIAQLSEEDRVVIFYSHNADTITFEAMDMIFNSKAQVSKYKILCGGKNALDFQLSTYLGYLIHEAKDSYFYIISKDNGFKHVVDFWKRTFRFDGYVYCFATIADGNARQNRFKNATAKERARAMEEELAAMSEELEAQGDSDLEESEEDSAPETKEAVKEAVNEAVNEAEAVNDKESSEAEEIMQEEEPEETDEVAEQEIQEAPADEEVQEESTEEEPAEEPVQENPAEKSVQEEPAKELVQEKSAEEEPAEEPVQETEQQKENKEPENFASDTIIYPVQQHKPISVMPPAQLPESVRKELEKADAQYKDSSEEDLQKKIAAAVSASTITVVESGMTIHHVEENKTKPVKKKAPAKTKKAPKQEEASENEVKPKKTRTAKTSKKKTEKEALAAEEKLEEKPAEEKPAKPARKPITRSTRAKKEAAPAEEKPVKEKTAKEKPAKEKLVQEKPAEEATEPKKPARRGRRPKAQSNIAASFE
ncbi:MAG: PIN domain-containing protein [Lachnospiraceae bacterium]